MPLLRVTVGSSSTTPVARITSSPGRTETEELIAISFIAQIRDAIDERNNRRVM
jgi:hypothetical protein